MQGFTFTFTNITVWVHSVQFSYVISAMLIQPNVLPSLLTSILYNFPGNVFLQNELWWDSKLMFTVWQCITAWLHQLLTEKFKTHEPMYLCKPHISCYSFHLHKNSWLQSLFLKNSIRRIRRDLSLSLPWLSIYLKKKHPTCTDLQLQTVLALSNTIAPPPQKMKPIHIILCWE